jgi:hypothetical protein
MNILAPNGDILFKGTNNNGESLYTDDSVRDKSLMGTNTLVLKFSTIDAIDFPLGCYAFFSRDNTNTGEYYYLLDTEKIVKNSTRNHEYEITFESQSALLKTRIFKFFTIRNNSQTTPARDSMYETKSWFAGTPKEFLQLIVMSMNDGDAGWEIGECLEGMTKTLEFNNVNCAEFLQQLADAYNTEWEVTGKIISLRKVEKMKDSPMVLSYGKDKGFKPGIVKDKGKSRSINRLLIQGGDRNIVFSRYGHRTLLLPKDRTIVYEGVTYKTDQYGKFLQRADMSESVRIIEDVLDLSEIYPMREGLITDVVVNETEGIYTITDSSLVTEGLNYTECFIEGVTPTLALHSGDVTGREFNIEHFDASTGTFTIAPHTDGGMLLPNDLLKPQVGNKYAVFNIAVPAKYIADAENNALNESVAYLHEESKDKFTVTGEVQGLYAKRHWAEIGNKLDIGYFVQFDEPSLLPTPENVRITRITESVNKPMMPELELTNEIKVNSWSNLKNDINRQEVVADKKVNDIGGYGRRSIWDVRETQKMMIDPDGQFQTELTSSLLAEFGHLVIGLNSAQMDFTGVRFQPNYDNNPNNFRNTAGKLIHFTINGDETTREWDITASNYTLNSSYAYYVYARCARVGTSGTILVTTEQITVSQVNGFYHFLVGILNTPRTDSGITTRSWKPVFGFTEISGSDIVTGVIRDRLSRLVIDLVNGEIFGKVTFRSGTSGYNNISDKPDLSKLQDIDTAINLAGEKARVFRTRPYPPYTAGDLWVNGNKEGGNDIFVCVTNRASGSYNANDWALPSNHDNTKVVIDNGVVTAGRIQLVGNAGVVRAGITGGGIANTSVRIWAGGTFEDRAEANMRITEDGSIFGSRSIVCADHNRIAAGGFSSDGTTPGSSGPEGKPGSIRLWVGYARVPEEAPFRVSQDGTVFSPTINTPALYMPNEGQINMYSKDGTRTLRAIINGSAFQHPAFEIIDRYGEPLDRTLPALRISIGRSAYRERPRTWIDCGHVEGWGSKFIVESRFVGDSNAMERTCINVGAMLPANRVQGIAGTTSMSV